MSAPAPRWWHTLAGDVLYNAAAAAGRTVGPDSDLARARLAACLSCDRCARHTKRDDPTRHVWACGVCRCIVGASAPPEEMEDPLEPDARLDSEPARKTLCIDARCPHPDGDRWARLTVRAT